MNKAHLLHFLDHGYVSIPIPSYNFDLVEIHTLLFDFFLCGNKTKVNNFQEYFDKRCLFHVGRDETKLPKDLTELFRVYNYLDEIAQNLMGGLTTSFRLPPEYFKNKTQGANSFLRPTLFWGKKDEITSDVHIDTCLISILFGATHDGLEILNTKTKKWDVIEDMDQHLVVLAGSLLSELTNGLIKATKHRVRSINNEVRLSLPFFLHAQDNALMEKFNFNGVISNQKKPKTYREYLILQNKIIYFNELN